MTDQWTLILFAACICTGAGMFLSAAIAEIKELGNAPVLPVSIMSLCLIIAGGLFALINLGHPEMLLGALRHFGTPISFQFALSIATVVLIAAYIGALMRQADFSVTRILAVVGAVSAVCLVLSVGFGYYMPWRPAWSTWTLILPFLGFALASGATAYQLLASADEENPQPCKYFMIVCFLLPAFLALLYLTILQLSGGDAAVAAITAYSPSAMGSIFWVGVVLAGTVIPLVIWIFGRKYLKNEWITSAATWIFLFMGTAAYQAIVLGIDNPAWHFFRK